MMTFFNETNLATNSDQSLNQSSAVQHERAGRTYTKKPSSYLGSFSPPHGGPAALGSTSDVVAARATSQSPLGKYAHPNVDSLGLPYVAPSVAARVGIQ